MTMLQPVKNLNEYKRIKEALRERFETERTGDQNLFREQSKILQPLIKPLISTQEQTVKAIQDNRFLARDVQRRPALMDEPIGEADLVLGVAPEVGSSEVIKVDLDSDLNETDKRNLQDMNFDMPSVVFTNKKIEATIAKIKTENRRIGQKLGRGSEARGRFGDATELEKEKYESFKKTLKIYRQKIEGLEGAKQFVGKGLKKSDVLFYSSVDDLCTRLLQLYSAKQAGNTGLDNIINSILDELSKVNAISKDEYDNSYKSIFPII
jgi:hypothetical protein